MNKQIQLSYAFNAVINTHKKYVFIGGHPVDTRSPKYKRFKQWFDEDKLYCFACHKKATHFKLVKCKGDGNIHKPSGQIKQTLKLYSDDDTVFTFDHWYPRWFLKYHNLKNTINNQVPMCKTCNREKWGVLPFAGRYNKTFYIPRLEEKNEQRSTYNWGCSCTSP